MTRPFASSTKKPFVSRETLLDGTVTRLAQERGDDPSFMSDDDLLASRRSLLPDDYRDEIWVFAYGSLLWNPVIETCEHRLSQVYGYHRRFCLKTSIGRGSPEQPGLVLGLDIGGSCLGVALKVAGEDPLAEIDLLWRREMLNGSYTPRWMTVYSGGKNLRAISFVMNRSHQSYVRDLGDMEKVKMIAEAIGFAGPCRDYLFETHDALIALDIRDQYIEDLYRRVKHPVDHGNIR